LYLQLDRRELYMRIALARISQHEQYGGTVHLFIDTGRGCVDLHLCPLQPITIITQIIMGQLVFSSLSQCHPSSQGVSLCRSSPDDSFGFAYVLIFRRCLFLRDLRRRSRPPTVAPSRCQIVFRNELDP
jgi:hypothetical protein